MLRRTSFFLLYAVVGLTVGLCTSPLSALAEEYLHPVAIPIPATPLYISPAKEIQMIADVNEARVEAGLAPLVADPELAMVARAYAQDMASRRYFGHLSPEGEDVGNRLNSARVNYHYAGENIAFVQSERQAMEDFLKSSGHRENILSRHYTHIGVGIIVAAGYGAIFVQEFSGT